MKQGKQSNRKPFIETKADVHKLIRSICEAAVVLVVLGIILKAFLVMNHYKPYDASDTSIVSGEDKGFLCISYFGIDRSGTDTLVSTADLKEQLTALHDLGYVTITQQDVIDYYEKGKALPDKALFLVFEDGRTDTAIYSQSILEKLNYKASMCSYGSNLNSKDSKMLKGSDLVSLEDNSYWENGTNGYRLSYINVFDRYNRFLGEMDSLEYNGVKQYLGREYNHYLMDYIRDENYMPVESYNGMNKRISYDYELMEKAYTDALGYVPQLYILMHSNTDMFGNNKRVSAVNEENMTRLFAMNINREGYALNTLDSDIYDLTRLQSQAYWSTNHLLMRIWDDLDEEDKDTIQFVTGDKKRSAKWNTELGAAEFQKERIFLTSLPKGTGLLSLRDRDFYRDVEISTTLTGNYCGEQTIYLRSQPDSQDNIGITFKQKELLVSQSGKELAKVNLDELHQVTYLSVEEDKRDALAKEYEIRGDSARTLEESLAYDMARNDIRKQKAATVEEGAEPYIPVIEANKAANWDVTIWLQDNGLTVKVNDVVAVEDLHVDVTEPGRILLEAKNLEEEEYRQRNLTDDVYEARFENLVITDLSQTKTDTLYDNRLHGLEKVGAWCAERWTAIINWFIRNL